jgi:hypothetical protein
MRSRIAVYRSRIADLRTNPGGSTWKQVEGVLYG